MNPMVAVVRAVVSRVSHLITGVVKVGFAKALTSPEGHHHHARHVNSGEQRRQRANGPKRLAPNRVRQTKRTGTPGFPQDLVFRKEPGEDWYAGNSQPTREHGCKGDGHILLES